MARQASPELVVTGDDRQRWLMYDEPTGTIAADFEGVPHAGLIERGDWQRLLHLPAERRLTELEAIFEASMADSEVLFAGWFAAVFGAMVGHCDTLRLGSRGTEHDLVELSKLHETERVRLLDRDADCSGAVDDHLIVLLSPVNDGDPVRLYHFNLVTLAIVPPTPLTAYRKP